MDHECCPCVARLSAELRAELTALILELFPRPEPREVCETTGRVEWRGVRPELRLEYADAGYQIDYEYPVLDSQPVEVRLP